MPSPRTLRVILLAVGIGLAPVGIAKAQDDSKVAAARDIGFEGVKAYEAKDFKTAHDKLERAYALVKAPTIGLWSARALVKVGKLVAASERYLETTRLPLPDTNRANHEAAQKDAANEREQLLLRIPSLTITVEGAEQSEVTIALDGRPLDSALIGVAQPIDPGKHTIEGKKGELTRGQSIDLVEGQKQAVVLNFAGEAPPSGPVAPPPTDPVPTTPTSSGPPTLAYVALGVGGVGLIAGAVTGFIAMGKKSDLEDNPSCRDEKCGPDAHSDVDSLNSMRTISTIGFAVGAVGIGAGVVLLLSSGKSETERATAPRLRIGPGNVSFGGRF